MAVHILSVLELLIRLIGTILFFLESSETWGDLRALGNKCVGLNTTGEQERKCGRYIRQVDSRSGWFSLNLKVASHFIIFSLSNGAFIAES